jgi:thioredoxin
MTVHGAKGLEAPIVILPDTMRDDRISRGTFLTDSSDMPIWNVSQDLAPDSVRVAKDIQKAADAEERQRLLYVAMTRAKSWLIVGGVEKSHGEGDNRWHQTVKDGLIAAGASRTKDSDGSEILRLEHGVWPLHKMAKSPYIETNDTLVSPVYHTPVNTPAAHANPITPSDLGGAKVIAGDSDEADTEAAMQRGTHIHLLLETLPQIPEDSWNAATRQLLPDVADPTGLLDEARQAMRAFPEIFADTTLPEVDVTAQLPTLDRALGGTIDRLVITPDRVLAVDFKTNRGIPNTPEDTPDSGPVTYGPPTRHREAIPCTRHYILTSATRLLRFAPLPAAKETDMATIAVTDDTFDAEVRQSDVPVVVDFWAEWCGPCKMIGPALEELSEEYGGNIKIAKVNVDENPNSPAQLGVRGIPALFLFKNGEVVSNKTGAAPKAALKSWIDESV